MKNKKSNLFGFTLIELLVVVLIIGILAAVALPQYQKTVDRARYSELSSAARILARSLELYYVEHGTYPEHWRDLVVEFPDCQEGSNPNYDLVCPNWYFDLGNEGGASAGISYNDATGHSKPRTGLNFYGVFGSRSNPQKRYPIVRYFYENDPTASDPGTFWCAAASSDPTEDERARRTCKSICGFGNCQMQ